MKQINAQYSYILEKNQNRYFCASLVHGYTFSVPQERC